MPALVPCRSCGTPLEPACGGPTSLPSGVCHVCGAVQNPVTGQLQPAPGTCGPGLGNRPVPEQEYRTSLGVCLQDIVDNARRFVHELGLRPYRVFLVWWDRDRRQRFTEESVVRRVELVPVKVGSFDSVRWELSPSGMYDDGLIQLSQVSPAQVDAKTLLGKLDGEDPPPGVEFFYEVVQHKRCPDDRVQPGRYTPAAVPYFDAERFEWVVVLGTQQAARSTAPDRDTPDRDNTFKPARLRRKHRNTLRT